MLGANTTFSERVFHSFTVLIVKVFIHSSILNCSGNIILVFPILLCLVTTLSHNFKNEHVSSSQIPFVILYNSTISPLSLQYDSVGRFRILSLSVYGKLFNARKAFICSSPYCFESISMSLILYGAQTELAQFSCDLTKLCIHKIKSSL